MHGRCLNGRCKRSQAERVRFGRQENVTLGIVTSLFHEMAPLFPDEYFNIGSDETFSYANAVGPNCT